MSVSLANRHLADRGESGSSTNRSWLRVSRRCRNQQPNSRFCEHHQGAMCRRNRPAQLGRRFSSPISKMSTCFRSTTKTLPVIQLPPSSTEFDLWLPMAERPGCAIKGWDKGRILPRGRHPLGGADLLGSSSIVSSGVASAGRRVRAGRSGESIAKYDVTLQDGLKASARE
jgi:hypothetical protein